jgi:dimethylhistidine N-methyltransferase
MNTLAVDQFKEDVLSGLRADQKSLPSKYFYDENGDRLFQQIMKMDSYYLSRKELDIFQKYKEDIARTLDDGTAIRIIELGAGDGSKTRVLLRHFLDIGLEFTYTPVDISGHVLEICENKLLDALPDLAIDAYQGDYFDALADISKGKEKDVVFFLGSNIGNFGGDSARLFLKKLGDHLKQGDRLFMGVDMKKDPAIILKAYNDDEGITRAFNFNLLERINRELDARFDTKSFIHYPYYNPQTGECRSYLISTREQEVEVAGEILHFDRWEAIFTEISKKFSLPELDSLARYAGFRNERVFQDDEQWFSDVVWIKE